MALEVGTRLGPYEVLGPIDNGGASEVYKATDTRLDRTVALRMLPSRWAEDPEAKQRLEEQVHFLAALSHPHICTLHDIGRERVQRASPSPATSEPGSGDSEDAADFLVMEYLEGETLAKRLARGALPLRETLKIAIAITDALDKAHQTGIVHRGLAPSNVMLTENGVKLLDFGLADVHAGDQRGSTPSGPAKSQAPAGSAGTGIAKPPAVPAAMQYMAPEQVEGKPTDARTDIFAFGAVLYEMVTGTKAFEGKNRPLLIAAIVTLDLDALSKARPGTPPALDHIAKRCLAKDPDNRWQTAHDLNLQLRWIAEGGAMLADAARGTERRTVVVAAVAVVALAVIATPAALYLRGPVQPDVLQYRVPVYGLRDSDIALSPDGETIALVARPDPPEAAALYVRASRATTFRRMAGTEEATQPFWSPDGRSVGFVAGGRLKKIDAAGGPPQNIADAPGFTGGSWASDGTILFGSTRGIFRVSAEGGKPDALTSVDKNEIGHYWPYFLPDGTHFVYLAWSAEVANRALFLGSLDSKDRKRIAPAESNAAYAAPGYLVYHREATLFAQRWDAKALALTGQPLHIADELAFNAANGRGSFDVSQNGALIYFQGQGGPSGRAQTIPNVQYGWRDRAGNQIGFAGEMGPFGDIDLSPDGKLFAVTRQDPGAGSDIWVTDWERGATTRLTLDAGDDINPVWSPDGLRIAFTTYRNGNADIYVKNANGVGPETPLLNSTSDELVEDWSKDGRYIAYKLGQDASHDLYVLPLFGDKKPLPVVQGKFQKDEPQFSYDGKWLAYTSDESGTFHVYVIAFPGGQDRHQVSTTGGGQPRWTRSGKELYYKGPDDGVMVADLTLATRIQSGVPRRLFNAAPTPSSRDPVRHQWSIVADGSRFLIRYQNGSGATTGARAGGPVRGAGGAVPFLFVPSGAAGVSQTPIGRGANFSNFPPSGLTMIRHWTSLFREAAK